MIKAISPLFLPAHPHHSFGFLDPEDGTNRLYRNVGKKLLLPAA